MNNMNKKFFSISIAFVMLSAMVLLGCQAERKQQAVESSVSSSDVTMTSDAEESWKEIQELPDISKEQMSEYYKDYIENVFPKVGMTEEREECIKAFRKDHPVIYDGMVKPLPVFLEDQNENVIVYYKNDGNVYYYDVQERCLLAK